VLRLWWKAGISFFLEIDEDHKLLLQIDLFQMEEGGVSRASNSQVINWNNFQILHFLFPIESRD
jgi:hypothetical protein